MGSESISAEIDSDPNSCNIGERVYSGRIVRPHGEASEKALAGTGQDGDVLSYRPRNAACRRRFRLDELPGTEDLSQTYLLDETISERLG